MPRPSWEQLNQLFQSSEEVTPKVSGFLTTWQPKCSARKQLIIALLSIEYLLTTNNPLFTTYKLIKQWYIIFQYFFHMN